ncbi:MAG: ATP synthase subunit I [Betaproteobacteria bacterium]|nr:ATP synthase subunit I [Betaproteobacteria bacterium]
MALPVEGKPIRTALLWLLCATAVSALIGGLWQGIHGAVSAFLGGLINLTAGAVFGWVGSRSAARTPGETLRALFRAEASKVALIVIQLWLVLGNYKQIQLVAFFATFFLTVILFSTAFFVRER